MRISRILPTYSLVLMTMFLFVLGPTVQAKDRLWQQDFQDLYSEQIDRAVQNGLRWLANHQNEDGSWTNKIGYKLNETVRGKRKHNVGVTAIAGLSFISAGNFPGRGKYGEVVRKALQYVKKCAEKNTGYISCNGSRMYEHGFATLFLAELYGMTGKQHIRKILKRAVRIILDSQNKEGGWRYQPRPNEADISVTVTVMQSLRAAQNVGIYVPSQYIEKAMDYVNNCFRHDGAFYYQTKRMSRTSWALTAAGVVSLQSAGKYESRKVQKGIQWLWKALDSKTRIQWGNYHYFYGHYYTSQALYQAGWNDFQSYYQSFSKEVLRKQNTDGSWLDDVGKPYATAMATLILQLPTRYLPIFQK